MSVAGPTELFSLSEAHLVAIIRGGPLVDTAFGGGMFGYLSVFDSLFRGPIIRLGLALEL